MTIDRQEAEGIARLHTKGMGRTVFRVALFEEISWARPRPYGVDPQRCWIAYLEPSNPCLLQSSDIIVISPESRRVVYVGSAQDEG